MKFLFEYVNCFAPFERSEEQNAYQRRQDTRALVPLPCAADDEVSPPKNRGKLNRLNSGSATQWKPSLSAISEDKIVFVVAAGKRERTVRSGEKFAGKRGSKPRVLFHDNNNDNGNEYRRSSNPAVFPAFTPTAFFF